MPTLPSRQELKKLIYRDLQKICKDWGVRANLKSDEMIDLLLEAQSHNMTTLARDAPPKFVSTKRQTSRTAPTRLSSVVIHHTQGEANRQQDDTVSDMDTNDNAPEAPSRIPVRTRKARELQKRLGVGRPAALGGSGPRTTTRQSTISRERRLRSSRSLKTLDATAEEAPLPRRADPSPHPQPLPSIFQEDEVQPTESNQPEEKGVSPPDLQQLLSSIVKPLQDQIDILRAEVRRLQFLETEIQTLGTLVKQTRASQNGEGTQEWETVFGSSKRLFYPLEPSTPPPNPHLGLSSEPQILMPSPKITNPSGSAGIAPVLLGKRPRESSISELSVIEGEGRSRISSPAKRRLKLAGETSAHKGKEAARDESSSTNRDATPTTLPRTPSFVVYNDPDEEESPPPNNPLPEYYTSRSGGSPQQGRPMSYAKTSENQNTFHFSLLPEPPTPGSALFLPAFPYPEPPQSPTPTGAIPERDRSNSSDRSDIFKTFGLPPPGRARRLPSSSNMTINPGALTLPPGKQHRLPSSDDARPGANLTASTVGESSMHRDRDPSRVKKTMYGTELEGDTRFGDFGVEGVAMGFWTGGRF